MLSKTQKTPYTRALISAVLITGPCFRRAVPNIIGNIGRPIDPPPGCRFTLRCPYSDETCSQTFLKLDMNTPHGMSSARCFGFLITIELTIGVK